MQGRQAYSRFLYPISLAATFTAWLLFCAYPAYAQEQPNPGQELYSQHCAACHGAFGEGSSAPDLTNPRWQLGVSDSDLDRIIRDGVPGKPMPAFGNELDSAARQSVVTHLRGLAQRAVQPTTSVVAPAVSVGVERLRQADDDRGNWLMYGRNYGNQRFSPLDEINKKNVANLVPTWSFQTGTPDGIHATPLVVNGVIYLSTAWSHVFAIDASTGVELWHYQRRIPDDLKYCCGPVNWGVAILDDTLYLGTLDAHLVALDAQTGRVRWDVAVGDTAANITIKSTPLAIAGKVIVGVAGGDFPSRGHLDAYDAKSGERLWRFYTVPGAGEKGSETWSGDSFKIGGGGTWGIGSYDAELNLVYWGVGQPYPDYDGDAREGDNLYTDSVIALDADTGKLRWHFQYTPHDMWDWDGINELVFADLDIQGRSVKAMLHADRNGHLYALERATGKFLYAKPFVRVTWTKGFDADGRPMFDPAAFPTYEGVTVCPGAAGGKEWNAMSINPLSGMVFVPAIENCAKFYNYGVKAKAAGLAPGPSGFKYLPGEAYGKLMAIRADTGEAAWEVKTRTPLGGGTLATAGSLVFTGDAEGNFGAYDDASGELLWSYQTGSGIRAGPVSFELAGKQYVAIASGMGGAVGGYTGPGAPWMKNYRSGNTLYVFALFEPGKSKQFHGGAR